MMAALSRNFVFFEQLLALYHLPIVHAHADTPIPMTDLFDLYRYESYHLPVVHTHANNPVPAADLFELYRLMLSFCSF